MESPPEKEEGALGDAPTPKLTRLAEDNSRHSFAQPCGHPATRTERLPDRSLHFARLRCAICGKHLRWLARPENVERQKLNAFKLAKLSMCSELNSWEREFLRSISHQPRLSPKQQTLLARLATRYLEAQTMSEPVEHETPLETWLRPERELAKRQRKAIK